MIYIYKKKQTSKEMKNCKTKKKCTKIEIMARTLTPKENGCVSETRND